jgi:hypothetical protein
MSVGRCFLNGVKNTEIVKDRTTTIADGNVDAIILQFQTIYGTTRTNIIGVQ